MPLQHHLLHWPCGDSERGGTLGRVDCGGPLRPSTCAEASCE